jgi:hypothetical protein
MIQSMARAAKPVLTPPVSGGGVMVAVVAIAVFAWRSRRSTSNGSSKIGETVW